MHQLRLFALGLVLCALLGCQVTAFDRYNWPCLHDTFCGPHLACQKPCASCRGRCRKAQEPAPCQEKATRPCAFRGATESTCPGTQTCIDESWRACERSQPAPQEQCDGKDNDCDGLIDEGLTRSCYTGPPGTLNVGACREGTQRCNNGTWGSCEGEVLPLKEDLCGSTKDENCDSLFRSVEGCEWVSAPITTGQMSFAPIFAEAQNQLWLTGTLAGNAHLTWGTKKWGVLTNNNALFIAHLDRTGHPIEIRTFTGNIQGGRLEGQAIARDPEGNLYVTGTFRGSVNFGNNTTPLRSLGKEDIFVLKLDQKFRPLWAISLGGPDRDGVSDLKLDHKGQIFLAGYFRFRLEALDTKQSTAYSLTSYGDTDILVAKLQKDGVIEWLRHAGGQGADQPGTGGALAPDQKGGTYLVGHYDKYVAAFGSHQLLPSRIGPLAFVTSIDKGGTFIWAYNAQSWISRATSITHFVDGGKERLTIGGTYQGKLQAFTGTRSLPAPRGSQDDFFLTQIDGEGTTQWLWPGGGLLHDTLKVLAQRQDGYVMSAGEFRAEGEYGGRSLSSKGGYDIFMVLWDRKGISRKALSAGGGAIDSIYGALYGHQNQLYILGRCVGSAAAQLGELQQPCTSFHMGQWYIWKQK